MKLFLQAGWEYFRILAFQARDVGSFPIGRVYRWIYQGVESFFRAFMVFDGSWDQAFYGERFLFKIPEREY